jgi:hypothetical protein
MVMTVKELHISAEQIFSDEILFKAGTIVDQYLSGEISIVQYEHQRNILSQMTSNPELMAKFMDCHPQRRIQNGDKIQVSIP